MYIVFQCPPLPHLIVGGTSSFRVGDSHLHRRLSDNFDLIYVHTGTLYMDENGQHFSVHPGEFLILPPQRLHRGTRPCTEKTFFYWLHFATTGHYFFEDQPIIDSNAIQKSEDQFHKRPFHVSLPQYGTIPEERRETLVMNLSILTQVRIRKEENSKRFYNSSIPQIKMQQTFFTILTELCSAARLPAKPDLAAEIYEYLQDHFSEDISLARLSAIFSCHPVSITRLMKKKYQQSPKQLILAWRLRKAAEQLQMTTLPVQRIAWDVGFHDNAYFSRIFKKNLGMTPHAYRETHCQEDVDCSSSLDKIR